MTRYLVFRLAQAAIVLLVMSFITYGLLGLMPGDPIDLMVTADPRATSSDVARLKALHGLDRPLIERYGTWLAAAANGDFGYSRLFARPVLDVLADRLPNTLILMSLAFLLALAVAVPMGVAAARRRGGLLDRALNLACFAGIAKRGEVFDASMCNPPFHASAEEAADASRKKRRNLGLTKTTPVLNFGGQAGELWCQGGELGFIQRMIAESAGVPAMCRWFTTQVSKSEHLPRLRRSLNEARVVDAKIIDMAQGQKKSRVLAWTFFRPGDPPSRARRQPSKTRP